MTAPTADATSTDTSTDADIEDEDNLDDDALDSTADDAAEQGADELGVAGKKALDAMKAKWRNERARAKAAEDKLAAASKPVDKADEKPDLDALREQIRAESRADTLRDKVLDKIEAKAARLFSNPEDARVFLASKVDDFIDDGSVDVDAISESLADLLKERPYLSAQGGKRFQGTNDAGARKAAPSQLTRADLKGMSPDQILEAQASGRMNALLGKS